MYVCIFWLTAYRSVCMHVCMYVCMYVCRHMLIYQHQNDVRNEGYVLRRTKMPNFTPKLAAVHEITITHLLQSGRAFCDPFCNVLCNLFDVSNKMKIAASSMVNQISMHSHD